MARPSKAPERIQQISEATIRTIAKYGYAETTLDRIAEESGLARGHIRHYAGNRQEVIRAAAKSYYFGENGNSSFFTEDLDSVDSAVNFLFGKEFIGTREENVVIFGFIEAARADSEISQILLKAYLGAEEELAILLKAEYPRVPSAHFKNIAFSIISIAIHNVFLLDISSSANTTALAKASAHLALKSLKDWKVE